MTAADQLKALTVPVNGNATGDRGQITALREDGTVNVRTSGGALLPGVPALSSYVGRSVGDWVQIIQAGNSWVVLGPYGPDADTNTPLLTGQSKYLYNLISNQVMNTQPSSLWLGRDPLHSGASPASVAIGYWNGTKNILTSNTTGHSFSPIYLTVARTADSIGTDGPISIEVMPHNSDVLPTGSIAPLTGFSTLLVNLEVGERKDIALPADWVAGITAVTPTIRGFVFIPGKFTEASSAIDYTYAILSTTTGGITLGQWQAWQPVWSAASGVQPSVGAGSITGRYTETNKLVTGAAQITLGTGFVLGTGTYRITYPVPPRIGSPDMVCLLRLSAVGGSSYVGQAVVNDNLTMNLQGPFSTTNFALVGLTGAIPAAWTAGTTVRVNFSYEAA